MINNSINVSKLHIIRKKNDCSFRWYALHLLKFVNFEILSYSWFGFSLKHPVA